MSVAIKTVCYSWWTVRTTGQDRSYTWGDIKTVSSKYIGAAFSDHMLHLVRLECPEATEAAEDHFKPYFKISPETAKDAEFQDRVQQQAAKQISRERAKEKRATLTFLMLVQSHLSKKTSKGNLSLLPNFGLWAKAEVYPATYQQLV